MTDKTGPSRHNPERIEAGAKGGKGVGRIERDGIRNSQAGIVAEGQRRVDAFRRPARGDDARPLQSSQTR